MCNAIWRTNLWWPARRAISTVSRNWSGATSWRLRQGWRCCCRWWPASWLQPGSSLRLAVGTTYFDLGLLSEAERNLRASVTLRRSALGPTNLDTLVAQHELAKLLLWQRNLEEGGRLIRETWQDRLRLLGAEDRDTLDSQQLYGGILLNLGQLQEAETIARQILQIRERVRRPDDYD